MGDQRQTDKPSRYVTSYVTSHPGQLSLAIPPWVGAMSVSERWDVNRHTALAVALCQWSRSINWCLVEG